MPSGSRLFFCLIFSFEIVFLLLTSATFRFTSDQGLRSLSADSMAVVSISDGVADGVVSETFETCCTGREMFFALHEWFPIW